MAPHVDAWRVFNLPLFLALAFLAFGLAIHVEDGLDVARGLSNAPLFQDLRPVQTTCCQDRPTIALYAVD